MAAPTTWSSFVALIAPTREVRSCYLCRPAEDGDTIRFAAQIGHVPGSPRHPARRRGVLVGVAHGSRGA